MKQQIEKAYDAEKFEDKVYETWEKSGYFKPEINMGKAREYSREKDGAPFVISMPPPNVTGKLHIGHSLFVTVQDIMARYHRLLGEPTLWLPGMDHAGIATQTVVDKKLKKEGINKNEIGREKFVEEVWKWKEEYGGIILKQLRKMGASCDWSREKFTLDKDLSETVNKAFVDLYNKGLIYRGEYIVNWCPRCQTAIADDEVEHVEQNAKLYYFKYDKDFPITIATTRPETKLGDTGVAVNPSDERYKQYIDKTFDVDIDGIKRKIKVFADHAVDKNFGTGAVGVTPAHSAIDWKMAKDNDLPIIKVIDEYGRMNENTGEYKGLKAKEAGEKLVSYLRANDLLEKEEDYTNNLSVCYRCGGSIEPLPSKQWFVKMKPLAEKAKKAVKSGEVEIIPKRFEKVYFHWLDNIRDWCISRQLWWGHRIPVWYPKNKTKTRESKTWNLKIYGRDIFDAISSNKKTIETRAGRPKGMGKYWGDFKSGDKIVFTLADKKTDKPVEPEETIEKYVVNVTQYDSIDDLLDAHDISKIAANGDEESYRNWWKDMPELQKRVNQYGIWSIELSDNLINQQFNKSTTDIYVGVKPPKDVENWEQDPDVLDTWFSSALWPFSTLGWLEETKDFKYFYPTTVMETGYDILFFWVARMIMMGYEMTGKAPFKTVYLHGLVRDEHNRKMSKSLGNALDPLELIPKYGTDAVRMALVVGTAPGQDIALGETKIKGYRNFANKIWNASRFVLLRVSGGDLKTGELGGKNISDLDIEEKMLTDSDKEILKKHKEIKKSVREKLDSFKFSQAGEELYNYFWHSFCDVYIEASKSQLEDNVVEENTKKILISVLTESLIMLHPFIPFVTEAVWQELLKLYPELSSSIMISNWPK